MDIDNTEDYMLESDHILSEKEEEIITIVDSFFDRLLGISDE